jgi:hypothetical protein
MIRRARRKFEGIPEPEGRGAFHADSRLQLREVVTGKKRSIEVDDLEQPGKKKRIQVPVLTKMDALLWAWDAGRRRWLNRLEWEALYGPANAPVWVHLGGTRWRLDEPEVPTAASGVPVSGAPGSAGVPGAVPFQVFKPAVSKHDQFPDDSARDRLAKSLRRKRGETQQAETLRIREERQLARRYGSGPGLDASPEEQTLFRHRVALAESARGAAPPPQFAVTLLPHWAHAVIWLGKANEMRSWAPDPSLVGQRLAIHAGSRLPEDWGAQLQALSPQPLRTGLKPGGAGREPVATASFASDRSDRPIRTGAIIGTVLLAEVISAGDGYAWILADPRPVTPIKIKGSPNVWALPPTLVAVLRGS